MNLDDFVRPGEGPARRPAGQVRLLHQSACVPVARGLPLPRYIPRRCQHHRASPGGEAPEHLQGAHDPDPGADRQEDRGRQADDPRPGRDPGQHRRARGGQGTERPLIAGVYLNRLNTDAGTVGLLNADPTLQYGLATKTYLTGDKAGPQATGPPSTGGRRCRRGRRCPAAGSLARYQTYLKGLPPSPIAAPSLASLAAVAEREHVDAATTTSWPAARAAPRRIALLREDPGTSRSQHRQGERRVSGVMTCNREHGRDDHTGDVKKGVIIELDGQLMKVLDWTHIKMARGSAQVRMKLQNVRKRRHRGAHLPGRHALAARARRAAQGAVPLRRW